MGCCETIDTLVVGPKVFAQYRLVACFELGLCLSHAAVHLRIRGLVTASEHTRSGSFGVSETLKQFVSLA